MRTLDHPRVWIAVLAAAFLCLVPLTWLQYRWIGEISRAERDRLQAYLTDSLARFAQDFNGEWMRLGRALTGGPGAAGDELEALAARCARLEEAGSDPRLIRNLFVLQ